MKQAINGASKWLIEKSKYNPIPYKFFKSIVDKQIEWAKKNRDVTLNFDELAESVKAELLKAGISVMSPDGKQSEAATSQQPHTIPDLTLNLKGDTPIFPALFGWLHGVFNKATAEGITELRFSVK